MIFYMESDDSCDRTPFPAAESVRLATRSHQAAVMVAVPAMLMRFGSYELDRDRRELRFRDVPVHVEPQVLDLLIYLVANRNHVVSKDEMVDAIWGGRIVSDVTLNSRINAARRAVGDNGKAQALIRTVPRRGFRFVGEVSDGPRDGVAIDGAPGAKPITAGSISSTRVQEVRFCRSPDGVNLALATSGSGFPVVRSGTWLTHIQRDWESPVWEPLFRRLAARFCLLRYDPRGCGLSDRQAPDISFEGFVRDLETVVDSLALERFALFGTSQSAAVSIAYAARHPDRVSQLVLSGGFALGWRKRGSAAEIATREAMLTLIEQGWGHDNPAFRQVFTARLWPDITAEQSRSFDELQRVSASAENAARVQHAVGEIDVTALLPSIKAPTLVLQSSADATVPRELGLMLAQGIPNARFVEIESRNHFPLSHEASWERYCEEILGFLETRVETLETD
jgi:pimeloyl-ACP methyl ester carboxylesterase/DNA-binding winged helix-turn-helix (wHTH) protein